MIPKTIHYCWFGGNKMPKDSQKYLETWKKHCPEYEIVRWDETNYDLKSNEYVKKAYEDKKWSFLSDYVRLDVVYKYGGIYFDTDVEVIRPIDLVLQHDAFFAFENMDYITTGLGFGSVKGNEIVKKLRDMYNEFELGTIGGETLYTPCPILVTKGLVEEGFKLTNEYQEIERVAVYPSDYFNPMDFKTKKMKITQNTLTINHYAGSWLKTGEKARIMLSVIGRRILGETMYNKVKGKAFSGERK